MSALAGQMYKAKPSLVYEGDDKRLSSSSAMIQAPDTMILALPPILNTEMSRRLCKVVTALAQVFTLRTYRAIVP